MRSRYEIVGRWNLWKSQDNVRFKRIMLYVFRACCHEPVLSHSRWASILYGKESYGLLRPRRPAPDVSSLVPVIYIRERIALREARCSRVHSSYARAEQLLKIMWPPYRAGSSHIHVSTSTSVVKIFSYRSTCESLARLSPDPQSCITRFNDTYSWRCQDQISSNQIYFFLVIRYDEFVFQQVLLYFLEVCLDVRLVYTRNKSSPQTGSVNLSRHLHVARESLDR